ncbi:uncharacterized protein LOC128196214 [Vigna angularis]|uniref:uncharacterized protein LOC128196214 n=1 Tax=Phaseolus angularis TaxID=3914 RepID=UPI0022B4F662|nr:uncharacterized protein LOC128196214 [Vigna angularis]
MGMEERAEDAYIDGRWTSNRNNRVCRGLKIVLETGEFVVDAFLSELDDIDLTLVMAWLESLGEMWVDWKKQIMKLNSAQEIKVLREMEQNESLSCNLYKFEIEGEAKKEEEASQILLEELKQTLGQYEDVFKEPKGLPPKRQKEHCINLLPRSALVNSGFSSPIILVKKKNNRWHMCVEYRALNKVTIPNKFPIPLIEELLDELHGVKYFLKLDLTSGYHQVRMREQDIEKTVFRTHEGQYEYLGREPITYYNKALSPKNLSKSLKQLLQQRITMGSQQNWMAKLLGYNFEIVYKLGCENKGDDACLEGTKLRMSSAYHPHTDGQTEVTNRCLETYLRCFIIDQSKVWINWLSWAELWFNTTYHESIRITSFEAVYGRPPLRTKRRGESRGGLA